MKNVQVVTLPVEIRVRIPEVHSQQGASGEAVPISQPEAILLVESTIEGHFLKKFLTTAVFDFSKELVDVVVNPLFIRLSKTKRIEFQFGGGRCFVPIQGGTMKAGWSRGCSPIGGRKDREEGIQGGR